MEEKVSYCMQKNKYNHAVQNRTWSNQFAHFWSKLVESMEESKKNKSGVKECEDITKDKVSKRHLTRKEKCDAGLTLHSAAENYKHLNSQCSDQFDEENYENLNFDAKSKTILSKNCGKNCEDAPLDGDMESNGFELVCLACLKSEYREEASLNQNKFPDLVVLQKEDQDEENIKLSKEFWKSEGGDFDDNKSRDNLYDAKCDKYTNLEKEVEKTLKLQNSEISNDYDLDSLLNNFLPLLLKGNVQRKKDVNDVEDTDTEEEEATYYLYNWWSPITPKTKSVSTPTKRTGESLQIFKRSKMNIQGPTDTKGNRRKKIFKDKPAHMSKKNSSIQTNMSSSDVEMPITQRHQEDCLRRFFNWIFGYSDTKEDSQRESLAIMMENFLL